MAMAAAGVVAAFAIVGGWAAGRVAPGAGPMVEWDPAAAVATVTTDAGPTRYRLGRPGDSLLVGDWDGDGSLTPALYRPATGEVFTFDAWAAGRAAVRRAPVAGRATVVRSDGRDRVEIVGVDGSW
jgi:hypothetical protein